MNEIMRTTTMPIAMQMDPMTVAQVFKASGMFPDIQSEAAACAKIIIGRGLGLTDYDAMTGLHIIKGKAVLASNLMAAAIKRAGKYDYRAECTEEECTIVFYGRTMDGKMEKIGTTSYTMEDAKRARLTGGDNWQKYPRAMLFARCISTGYKQHCPDALGSAPVYVEAHGEMEIQDDAQGPIKEVQTVRAVIEEPKGKKISAKQSFLTAVSEWAGCGLKEAIPHGMRILAALSLPVDGSVDDNDVRWAEMWVRTRIEEGHTMDILDTKKDPDAVPEPKPAPTKRTTRKDVAAQAVEVTPEVKAIAEELEF
jgi:hypothetical protein